MIHGEKAHSLYFSKDAFKKLTGDNKTLMIISGANHTDLYDNMKYIPMKEIVALCLAPYIEQSPDRRGL